MSGRIQAIQLPCCLPIPHQIASTVVSVLSAAIHILWSYAMWGASSDLLSIQRARSSNADLSLVEGMASYSAVTSYINISQSLVYIALIGFSIAPQPDFLKNLSRTTWLSWAISWVLGVLGILAYVAGNSYLKENCSSRFAASDCGVWWKQAQIIIIVGVLITLVFDFYGAVVISSFVHTLHPHLFFQNSDDEDDSFYDGDDEKPTLPIFGPIDSNSAYTYNFEESGARRRSPSVRRIYNLDEDDDEEEEERHLINEDSRRMRRSQYDYPLAQDVAEESDFSGSGSDADHDTEEDIAIGRTATTAIAKRPPSLTSRSGSVSRRSSREPLNVEAEDGRRIRRSRSRT